MDPLFMLFQITKIIPSIHPDEPKTKSEGTLLFPKSKFIIIYCSFNDPHPYASADMHARTCTHTHVRKEVCFCHEEKPFAHFDGGLKEKLSCLSGFFITKCNRAKKITAAAAGRVLGLLIYFLH